MQTVRGCPKHCSFCSVWRTDGQKPRQRDADAVVAGDRPAAPAGLPLHRARRRQLLPGHAGGPGGGGRRADKAQLAALTRLRDERFELMARLEQLPDDMVFYTQITMEAAEDPEFLDAMRRAHIRGALVGVESVTPEGLKAVFKDFNHAGEELVDAAAGVPQHGVHVLGSFIFGLPTDRRTRSTRPRIWRSAPASRSRSS